MIIQFRVEGCGHIPPVACPTPHRCLQYIRARVDSNQTFSEEVLRAQGDLPRVEWLHVRALGTAVRMSQSGMSEKEGCHVAQVSLRNGCGDVHWYDTRRLLA